MLGREVIKVEELHCLMCNEELSEDNFGRRNALVLTDEREQIPVVLGAWCLVRREVYGRVAGQECFGRHDEADDEAIG